MFCYPGDSWHGGSGEKKFMKATNMWATEWKKKIFMFIYMGVLWISPYVCIFSHFCLGDRVLENGFPDVSTLPEITFRRIYSKILLGTPGLFSYRLPKKREKNSRGWRSWSRGDFFPTFSVLCFCWRFDEDCWWRVFEKCCFVRKFQGKFKGFFGFVRG